MSNSMIRFLCCCAPIVLSFGMTACSTVQTSQTAPKRYLITDYGAVADGPALNTAAIQSTIDTASAQGGGTVVIPAGTFRSGSIFLKPGVGLYLSEGAVLKGSENIADYPTRRTRIEGHFQDWPVALVNAQEMDQLRIDGPGTLDGSGKVYWDAFWARRKINPRCTNVEVERPRLMFVDRCKEVRIEGINLLNSGFWNLHLYRCQDVVVEGVHITAPFAPTHAPSSDGIDIDSSQNVTVRKCVISVDDDCIALKGSKGPLADQDTDSPPVENITVEQCEFAHGNGLITCGSEATFVRHVAVRNCTITGQVVMMALKLRPDTPQLYEDIVYDGVKFSGGKARVLQALPWTQFFDLEGHAPPTSTVRNIVARNLSGEAASFGVLNGNPGDTIEGITLENLQLTLKSPDLKVGAVKGLTMTNVVVNGKPVVAPSPIKS